MRYTEIRMAKIAAELLADIDKEPLTLSPIMTTLPSSPGCFPPNSQTFVVNGSSGIAVGMATNIPPHNLVETINALIALIETPDISLPELMGHLPGPDFPTGGFIYAERGSVRPTKPERV